MVMPWLSERYVEKGRRVPDAVTLFNVGQSLVRVLARATNHDNVADALGDSKDGASTLLSRLTSTNPDRFAQDLARELEHLLDIEFDSAEEHDRTAAVIELDTLLQRHMGDAERLLDAVRADEALHDYLLQNGGRDSAESLGGISGDIFLFLLSRVAERIRQLAPQSPRFQPAALIRLLQGFDELAADVRQLTQWSPTGTLVAADVRAAMGRVRALAPAELRGRDAELAQMLTFARDGPGQWWAWRAPMQSGKTALMATFAMQHHPGIAVVPFCVRRGTTAARDRQAFLADVLPRLAQLAGDQYLAPIPSNAVGEINAFRSLLERAAVACRRQTPSVQVLLLIDGLDEDEWHRDRGARGGSILGLLPVDLPRGVRVLLSCRPHPDLPTDVETGSEIRRRSPDGPWRDLTPSPHARAAFSREDVVDFMATEVGREVAAYLLVAGAPLTVGNLTALTCLSLPNTTEAQIHGVVETSHGRLLTPSPTSLGLPAYTLAHDRIAQHVLTVLSPGLHDAQIDPDDSAAWDVYREQIVRPWLDRLCRWPEQYAAQCWPVTTPDYLLSHDFADLLIRTPGRLRQLADLLCDSARQEQIRARRGTLAPALTQVRTSLTRLTAFTLSPTNNDVSIELELVGRLSFADYELTRRLGRIPKTLPAVYARIGDHRMAEQLVDAAWDVVEVQVDVAWAFLAAGHYSRAVDVANRCIERLLREKGQAPISAESARQLVQILARAKMPERAREVARTIRDNEFGERAVAVRELVRAQAVAGEHAEARQLATALPEHDRCGVLTQAAYDCHDVGDLEGALAYAAEALRMVSSDALDSMSYRTHLARLFVRCGDPDRAWACAHDQVPGRLRILTAAATESVACGDLAGAVAMASSAAKDLSSVPFPGFARDDGALALVEVFIRTERTDEGEAVLARIADHISGSGHCHLAGVYFSVGDEAAGSQHLAFARTAALSQSSSWCRLDDLAEVLEVAVKHCSADLVRDLAADAFEAAIEQDPKDTFLPRTAARVAECLGRAGLVDEAVSLVRLIEEGPDHLAREALWHAVAAGPEPDRIVQVIRDTSRGRYGPSPDDFSDVALTLAYSGHADLARAVADEARSVTASLSSDQGPSGAGDMPTALARAGHLALSVKILEELSSHDIDYMFTFREAALHDHICAADALDDLSLQGTARMYAFIGLAEAALVDGRYDDGATLLAHAQESLPQPPSDDLQQAVTEIAGGWAFLRRFDDATTLISRMMSDARRPYALVSLVDTLAINGQLRQAQAAAATAIEWAGPLASDQGRAQSWIAHELAKHPDLAAQAKAAAQRALTQLPTPPDVSAPEPANPFPDVLARIIGALVLAGDLAAAKSILTNHENLLGSRLLDIAKDFALAGHLRDAEALFERSPQNRPHFAKHVVSVVASAGRPDDVRELTASIDDPIERADAHLALAHAYRLSSNRLLAIELVEAAVQSARLASHRAYVLAEASILLASCGELDLAAETAVEAAESPTYDGYALLRCAEALQRCGRPDQAAQALARAWTKEHSPYNGWYTLVAINADAALALAVSRWSELGTNRNSGEYIQPK